jgi:uncharacterized protein YggE
MRLSLFALLILLAFAVIAAAQNNIEPPLVTVHGQAEKCACLPDEVVFTLAVENVMDKDMVLASKRTD